MARYIFVWFFAFIALTSCVVTEEQLDGIKEYEGPLREATDVVMYYSDSAIVKIKMETPLLLEFESGDRDFPEGIYMEFFDEEGNITSYLKADKAYYFKEENKWRGLGNVEVKNIQSKEQLNTEELFWFPEKEEISTDKFVTIRQEKEVLYGRGLQAKQDFSEYTILNPEGEFYLDEND
jgi:LPS export ABC transporter protein LptC